MPPAVHAQLHVISEFQLSKQMLAATGGRRAAPGGRNT
jgi:hypothetical protein